MFGTMLSPFGNGYKICTIGCAYREVKQYWCIVSSEQAYKREIKTFEKRLEKLDASLENSFWHLELCFLLPAKFLHLHRADQVRLKM